MRVGRCRNWPEGRRRDVPHSRSVFVRDSPERAWQKTSAPRTPIGYHTLLLRSTSRHPAPRSASSGEAPPRRRSWRAELAGKTLTLTTEQAGRVFRHSGTLHTCLASARDCSARTAGPGFKSLTASQGSDRPGPIIMYNEDRTPGRLWRVLNCLSPIPFDGLRSSPQIRARRRPSARK